jgi:hypothetical protein
VTVKGISRPVLPYVLDSLIEDVGANDDVISRHDVGLNLFLDTAVLDDRAAARARCILQEALAALEQRSPAGSSGVQ